MPISLGQEFLQIVRSLSQIERYQQYHYNPISFIIPNQYISMQCTYCHTKLHRQLYACQEHPQIIACQGCVEYDCSRCKAELKRYVLQFCVGCKEHRKAKEMFGNQFYKFCLDCCLRAYKGNTSGKKVVLSNHIFQPDKFEVYKFLKNYCYGCRVNLAPERVENLDSGLREIYPLDINLCRKCSSDGPHKENTASSVNNHQYTKMTHHESYQSQRSTQRQRQRQLKQSNVNRTEVSPKRATTFQKEPVTETVEQKWKRIQKTQHLRCLGCGHLVLDDGLITDDMVICKLCLRYSKMEQQNRSSPYQKQPPKTTEQPRKAFYENPVRKSPSPQQSYPEDELQTPTFRQKTNLVTQQLSTKKTTSHQSARPKIPDPITIRRERSDSEEILENVPISVKFVDDSELIQCTKCGIRMEINSSIWEENSNRPVCRCCYSQIKEKIRKQRERYERPIYQRVENKNGVNTQASKRTVSPEVKSYIKSQRSSSPMTVQSSQKYSKQEPKPVLPTEPIIKQQEEKKPANKVRRTESWDQAIIVESVEDHQKRKREMLRENHKVIQEVNQEETQVKSRKTDSKKSQPIEPIIIDDDQETKKDKRKIEKLLSWDQQIVLEPVQDHLKRKQTQKSSKASTTEDSKQLKAKSPIKETKQPDQQIADFDRKYKEAKQKLDQEINNTFDSLHRMSPSRQSPIDSLASSRAETYSRYYRQEQKSAQQSVRGSNARPYQREMPVQYSGRSPFSKNTQSSTYSTYSSRRKQDNSTNLSASRSSNDLKPVIIGGYQQYSQNPGKQSFTGYKTLERKTVKDCQFCGLKYTTTLRDYYIRDTNVCWECFAEYNKAIGNPVI